LPLYEYQCPACGRFEVIRKFSDEPLTACPTCGQEIQKLLSAPAFQFKGTGWYVTDYARKSSPSEGSGKEGGKDKEPTSSSDSSTPKDTTSKDNSATGSSPSK
jgi:putative FmdB family regulatory protein